MKTTLGLVTVLLCLSIVLGCGKTTEEPAQVVTQPPRETIESSPVTAESAPPAQQAYAYDCDDGSYVVAQHDPDDDEMWLFLPGQTVNLSHVTTGSGARYANDDISFWGKGDEALLEYGGKSLTCIINTFRSKVETIKLSGGDFWATGNEPGLTLEIYTGSMVFTTNYGEDRYEAAGTKVSEDAGARMTVFRGEVNGRALVVTLRGEPCSDSMSDEEFETTVRIDFAGKVYEGCGGPLH